VMSHRHGDHMGGMSHLLGVNPKVRIYAPKESFGVYGADLPSSFYRKDESLPAEQRYYGGKPPEVMRFGSAWPQAISTQPPKVGKPFPVLVPLVDADGNERDGVRLPQIAVPLATYTGWNLRDPSIGAPTERVSFEGSYIAFAKTASERAAANDPRKSIAERYASREDYLRRYSAAIDDLVKQRWLLEEDRAVLMRRGEQEWDAAMK